MTHSGSFLFQTPIKDSIAPRDNSTSVQNARNSRDESLKYDKRSDEKSFDKTLEEVQHNHDIKPDESVSLEHNSAVEDRREANVFEVAKELKNELSDSGLSQDELDAISESGFINIVFALAEGRNASTISVELLGQAKEVISPELLNRINALVTKPADLSINLDFASESSGDDSAILNQNIVDDLTTILDTPEDSNDILNAILNKSTQSHAGQFFAANPDVAADDIIVGQPTDIASLYYTKNQGAYLANDIATQQVDTELGNINIATRNENILSNTLIAGAVANNQQATQQNQTQVNTASPSQLVANEVTTQAEGEADVLLQQKQSQNTPNTLLNNQTNNGAGSNLFKEHLHHKQQLNDESVIAQKVDNNILNVISEKSEIITAKSAQEAPSLAYKESTSVPDQIKVNLVRAMNGNQNHISIQLDPAELGKVDIKMEWQANGKTTVAVIVEKAETYDLLQKDYKELAKALGNAGLNVESGDLEFNLQQQNQQQQNEDQHYTAQSGFNHYAQLNEQQGESDEYYVESLVARLYDYNAGNVDNGIDISI